MLNNRETRYEVKSFDIIRVERKSLRTLCGFIFSIDYVVKYISDVCIFHSIFRSTVY